MALSTPVTYITSINCWKLLGLADTNEFHVVSVHGNGTLHFFPQQPGDAAKSQNPATPQLPLESV